MKNNLPQKIDLNGAQRLAAAVLVDCIKDALQGNPAAIYWLYSSDAAYYANLAGYDETGHLIHVARRCHPGRRKLSGRLNEKHFTQALSL